MVPLRRFSSSSSTSKASPSLFKCMYKFTMDTDYFLDGNSLDEKGSMNLSGICDVYKRNNNPSRNVPTVQTSIYVQGNRSSGLEQLLLDCLHCGPVKFIVDGNK